MAGTEIEPLPSDPAGETERAGLHDADSVKEVWQGSRTGGLSPTQAVFEEMSVDEDNFAFSDRCDDMNSNAEEMDSESDGDESFDPVLEEIKRSLSKLEKGSHNKSSTASLNSAGTSEEDGSLVIISDNYTNIPYGIQPRDVYEHGTKSTDIMGGTVGQRVLGLVLGMHKIRLD